MRSSKLIRPCILWWSMQAEVCEEIISPIVKSAVLVPGIMGLSLSWHIRNVLTAHIQRTNAVLCLPKNGLIGSQLTISSYLSTYIYISSSLMRFPLLCVGIVRCPFKSKNCTFHCLFNVLWINMIRKTLNNLHNVSGILLFHMLDSPSFL